jgi:hypothetical protein
MKNKDITEKLDKYWVFEFDNGNFKKVTSYEYLVDLLKYYNIDNLNPKRDYYVFALFRHDKGKK